MSGHGTPAVDLDDLDAGARSLVEESLRAGSLTVHRGGEVVGTLTFVPRVLVGDVLPTVADDAPDPAPPRAGTKVLATTMRLSDEARERLRETMGPGWLVLDLADAPETADVVLTGAHSPQLTQRWPLLFPQARIVVTEIHDPELGVEVDGPVGRLLDAGAHAYLPPRPVAETARNLTAYLAGSDQASIEATPTARPIAD